MDLATWISRAALATSIIGLAVTTRLTRKSQRHAIVREYSTQFLNDEKMQALFAA